MSSIKGKTRRTTPPAVLTDTVIPLHAWDNTPLFRGILLGMTLRFDDVLDPQKLSSALRTLLNRDGWRKLGARLKRNPSSDDLEYHIPAEFDDERPSFTYHHQQFECSISEHPTLSQLPGPDIDSKKRPCIYENVEEFYSLITRDPGEPKTLNDYISLGLPMLALHIVSFTNATVVALSWPHIVFDAMGRKALLDAWSLVLQGRSDEIPPLHGVETDPLVSLGEQATEPYKYADKRMGLWGLFIFLLRHFIDKIWGPRSVRDTRLVRVPAPCVKSLHASALADMCHDEERPTSFISEGDVLSAWWTRHTVQCLIPSPTSTQPVVISNQFGLRGRLDTMLPPDKPYLGNAVCNISIFTTARAILSEPVSHTAARIRRSFAEQGTRAQLEALFALMCRAKQRGKLLVFSDPWAYMVSCTNWTKARFFDVDFSAAVINQDALAGQHNNTQRKRGRPVLVLTRTSSEWKIGQWPMIHSFTILGKDAQGNVWIRGSLRPEQWAKIEQELSAEWPDV